MYWTGVQAGCFKAAINGWAEKHQDFGFIQIGENDGVKFDSLFDFIKKIIF